MERRLIVAIALSLLVLLSWSALVSKFYPIENKRVIEKPAEQIPLTPPPPLKPDVESEELVPAFSLSQEKLELVFIESEAIIKEVIFKDYQSGKLPLKLGFLLRNQNLLFKKESSSSQEATFVYTDREKRITKRFLFSNSNYNIDLEIEVQNLSSSSINLNLGLVLGVLNFAQDKNEARFQDVTVALKDKTLHLNVRKEAAFPEVKFLSLRDRYFCAIIEPALGNYSGFIQKINPFESEIGLNLKELMLAPGEKSKDIFHIYLGPQDLKQITRINPEWSAVMYYGIFDFISHILLQFLDLLHRLLRNWGWAIVSLSIFIYLIMYPLTLKQMRSMKQMQALQPRMEELRKIYKDNPQKLNKEVMELYRQHKVNPFGGCLPLVLQMPIFFALYQALMRSVALKGAHFFWIKDLSEPDRLIILPSSLPILGNEINILPLLMAIGMFFQQKMSLKTTSGGSAEQQKLMLIMFPIMFGIIFYRMPSGLVLYWFVNSSLTLLYQFKISRIK